MDEVVSVESARRVASVFAAERWSRFELQDALPILEMTDDRVTAYAFRVRTDDKEHPDGTVVIAANRDLFPLVLSCNRWRFAREHLVSAFKIATRLCAGASDSTPVFRMEPLRGYPVLCAEFAGRDDKRIRVNLISNKVYRRKRTERHVALAKEHIVAHREHWRSLERATAEVRVLAATARAGSHYIPGVPDLFWLRGCAPTAVANVLIYWSERGYPRLRNNSSPDNLIEELGDAMRTATDAEGATFSGFVDDGADKVANGRRGYTFDIDGPDSTDVWNKIRTAVGRREPSVLLLRNHSMWDDHAVTVVGYRESGDHRYVTVHDTWPGTDVDVEIAFLGNYISPYWQLVRFRPGPAETTHIHQMRDSGAVGELVESYKWSAGWTQGIPFREGIDQFLFLLKANGYGGDGNNIHIHFVLQNGEIGERRHAYRFSEGWTTASFYTVGSREHLFLLRGAGYDSDGCNARIYRIDPSGGLELLVASYRWTEGWTQAVPFVVNGKQFLFLLKERGAGADGYNVHVHRIDEQGVGERVWRAKWTQGWTTVNFFTAGAALYILILKRFGVASDGNNVHIYRVLDTGALADAPIQSSRWTEGWTQAKPFTVDGKPCLFILKKLGAGDDGTNARVYAVNDDGTIGNRLFADTWSEGWTSVEFYQQYKSTRLFLLKDMLAPGVFDASFTTDEPFDASTTSDQPFDASTTNDEPFDASTTSDDPFDASTTG